MACCVSQVFSPAAAIARQVEISKTRYGRRKTLGLCAEGWREPLAAYVKRNLLFSVLSFVSAETLKFLG